MRAAAPRSGADSSSDPRKLQEVQGLVAPQSWDTPTQNLDYVLVICFPNFLLKREYMFGFRNGYFGPLAT